MTAAAAPPLLAYVAWSLPGSTLGVQLAMARRLDVAVEVADDGALELAELRSSGVTVSAVQAYRLHHDHPLSPSAAARRRAALHVEGALDVAARLEAPVVVAVCGFGHRLVDRPFERCLDFYRALAPRARQRGVRILLEPLSPRRAGALTSPEEVAALLDALADPSAFGLLVDSGHLLDAGRELETFFAGWKRQVWEVQLRGRHGAPPTPDWPLGRWLGSLPAPPRVIAVEHRTPLSARRAGLLVEALRRQLEATSRPPDPPAAPSQG